jgi:hypothetical protein
MMELRSAMRVGARKIPRLSPLRALAGICCLFATNGDAQTVDTASLFRAARRAESEYETSVRRFAPVSFDLPRHSPCDEIVGRFCIYYESGGDSLPAEPEPIRLARDKAIAVLAKARDVMPLATPTAIAFPLVRLLIQAGRATEAVSVARGAAALEADSHMLIGYALHPTGDTRAATAELSAWLATLPTRERDRITSVQWLLDHQERRRYERLGTAQRQEYEERLWRYADPLYLTPGNELWTDHVARHALGRMLARRRGVASVDSWDEDLEQLTVRFGAPVLTTRAWRSGAMGSQEQYSEHWDPALRTYIPPDMAKALDSEARLDTIWPVDSMTARSGHAPPAIRSMHVLEHQASVFSQIFSVVGVARPDSIPDGAQLTAGVFLLDSALEVLGHADAVAALAGDSVVFRAELPLERHAAFYSAEVYEMKSRWAARARYRIDRPKSASELAVSSILLARPFEAGELPTDRHSPLLAPLNRAVIKTSSRIGVYAEVWASGPERRFAQVQIETSRVDKPGTVGKAVGWIGNKLGLAKPRTPTRLGWSVELEPGKPNALPVTLDLGAADPGRYRLTLTVKDPSTGESAVARRELLIVRARH